MLALSWLLAPAHVPTYVGGLEGCYAPPRHHTARGGSRARAAQSDVPAMRLAM